MYNHGGDIYTHENCIDFSANLNFRGMPDSVKQAAHLGVDSCGSYPDPQCRKLREALSLRENVPADWILCGNGAADLIFSYVQAIRPREALVLAPTFSEYEQALKAVGCQVSYYELKKDQGFPLDQGILDAVAPETDLVFVCNPNNPTGLLAHRELLEALLFRCRECGVYLVMDECFVDFLEHPKEATMTGYLESYPELFVLKAFTKIYGMAGLRLGYGLSSDKKLLEKIREIRQPWSVSFPAQMAGAAAAGEVEFARESAAIIGQERESLKQGLRKLGFHVLDGSANYLCFQGKPGLWEYCRHRGFLIRDCSNFRGMGQGWYRIVVKSHQENQQLLAVLEDWSREGSV